MLHSLRRSLPLASIAFLVGPLSAQQIAFRPNPGDQWFTQQDCHVNTHWQGMHVRVNGEEAPDQGWKVQLKAHRTLGVEDSVVAWDPTGRQAWERDYRTVGLHVVAPIEWVGGEETVRSEAVARSEGALVQQRILFERSAETPVWRLALVEQLESGQQPSPLPPLTPQLDFACLLPPAGIKEGQSWPVDPQALIEALFLHHGMELHSERKEAGDLPLWFGPLTRQPEWHQLWTEPNAAQTRASATLLPRRRIGSSRMHPIEFRITLGGDADLEDWAMDALAEVSSKEAEFQVEYATQNTLLTGSGTLLWNLETRRSHSLDFRGSATFTRSQSLRMQIGDESTHFEVDCDGTFDVHTTSRTREN